MNPQIGRFMGMDTFEGDNQDPLSLNKYAFVKGDGGVNMVDPSGQDGISDVGPSQYDAVLFSIVNLMTQTTSESVGEQYPYHKNGLLHIAGVPDNSIDYILPDGTPMLAPIEFHFSTVFKAGRGINPANKNVVRSYIGLWGKFDYQRNRGLGNLAPEQNTFYDSYIYVSNFNVGLFLSGAHWPLWAVHWQGEDFLNKENRPDLIPIDEPWWDRGWNYGNTYLK